MAFTPEDRFAVEDERAGPVVDVHVVGCAAVRVIEHDREWGVGRSRSNDDWTYFDPGGREQDIALGQGLGGRPDGVVPPDAAGGGAPDAPASPPFASRGGRIPVWSTIPPMKRTANVLISRVGVRGGGMFSRCPVWSASTVLRYSLTASTSQPEQGHDEGDDPDDQEPLPEDEAEHQHRHADRAEERPDTTDRACGRRPAGRRG